MGGTANTATATATATAAAAAASSTMVVSCDPSEVEIPIEAAACRLARRRVRKGQRVDDVDDRRDDDGRIDGDALEERLEPAIATLDVRIKECDGWRRRRMETKQPRSHDTLTPVSLQNCDFR